MSRPRNRQQQLPAGRIGRLLGHCGRAIIGLLLVFRTDSCYARYNEGIEQALTTVGRFRAVIGQLTARSVLYVGPERATCANICDQMVKVCDCTLLPCHTREPARPSRWPN